MAKDIHKLLKKLEEQTKQIFEYREQIKTLQKENSQLKSKLCKNENVTESKIIRIELTPQEKINLFLNTFRGRDDIYAERWISKKGNTGYSPAIKNGYYALKNKLKESIEYLPLNSSVIEKHLSDKKVIGLYPLLKDETCWLIAADFDKSDFKKTRLPTNRLAWKIIFLPT